MLYYEALTRESEPAKRRQGTRDDSMSRSVQDVVDGIHSKFWTGALRTRIFQDIMSPDRRRLTLPR